MTVSTANILGTKYAITFDVSPDEDAALKKLCAGGYTDFSTKQIVIAKIVEDETTSGDQEVHKRSTLRHEIIHAYLYESGLCWSSNECAQWAMNEEMVDWFALQWPRIEETMKLCNCNY